MGSFFAGLLLILTGGLAALFLGEKLKGKVFLLLSILSQFFIIPAVYYVLKNGTIIESAFSFSEPIGSCYFRMDPLSAVFILIISAGSLLAALYSNGYMKMYIGDGPALSQYYFFLGLMSSSMLLVVTVQNTILFLIMWELMSLASFFLVIFENKKAEVLKAGIYYFTAMQVGAAFLIAAFSWTSAISGSPDFSSFRSALDQSGSTGILLFILFFIGFGTKAGFIPFHTWLPRAHPAAPTGVSALMSGVMIKTGIYGIMRILLLSGIPDYRVSYGILILSILTGIFGVMNAIAQHDLKKLLAYHSIENIGIIGIGIGLGMIGLSYNNPVVAMLGFVGALLHTINHFTFKSVLFYGAGMIYSRTHTRNIDRLGGLSKYMPMTSVMFLIASLAITGLPVFNGFISEFAIYMGITKSLFMRNLEMNITAIIGISGLAFIGAMAFLCFTKVYGICFLGSPRTEFSQNINEKDPSMLIPMVVLTVVMLFIGLFPVFIIRFLESAVRQFVDNPTAGYLQGNFTVFNSISAALSIFIAVVVFFYIIRILLLRNREVKIYNTWGCGYKEESSRMQYTGSSFAQPFLSLVAEFIPQKIHVKKEMLLFPAEAKLETHSQDISESYLIHPFLNMLKRFMNLFSWIQSGRMQQYIIYGLIFLVFLLIWILGVE